MPDSPAATGSSDHPTGRPAESAGRGWAKAFAVGFALFLIYVSNGREIGTYDTIPTTMLAANLARGGGIVLERFGGTAVPPGRPVPPFLTWKRGHLVSRYPVGPALLVAPLIWAQERLLDRLRPGWDRDPRLAFDRAADLSKNAAAVVAALAATVLFRVLVLLGLGRVALPATLGAALGSDLWVVASQALWQHGPAALALISAIWLLLPERPSRGRSLLGGLATAVLVACRSVDVVFAAFLLGWVARTHPRRLPWFLPAPVLLGAAVVWYHVHYFGTPVGGQAELEALHPELHGVAGPWAGDPLEGALGTLLSPSRGLLVFCPWVALALVTAPFSIGRFRRTPLVLWMLASLVPYFLMFSKYAVWWGGHCFGPRYWTDAAPLLGILLAAGLDRAKGRRPILTILFGLSIAAAIVIQAIGAFCYPSSWNLKPADVDRHHERFWDWSDTELSRSLIEAMDAPGREGP